MPSTPAEVRAAGRKRSIELANARVRELGPIIKSIQAGGIVKMAAIGRELTRRGIRIARGNEKWTGSQVLEVLRRLEKLSQGPP